jgi:hypothetical protein
MSKLLREIYNYGIAKRTHASLSDSEHTVMRVRTLFLSRHIRTHRRLNITSLNMLVSVCVTNF